MLYLSDRNTRVSQREQAHVPNQKNLDSKSQRTSALGNSARPKNVQFALPALQIARKIVIENNRQPTQKPEPSHLRK